MPKTIRARSQGKLKRQANSKPDAIFHRTLKTDKSAKPQGNLKPDPNTMLIKQARGLPDLRSKPKTTLDILKKVALYAPAIKPEALPKDTVDILKKVETLPVREEAPSLTAQELLDKSPRELEAELGKREAHNLLKQMKIITAILLGKKKNRELAQVLDTDKSFTSKQIRSLEDQGLVKREGEGKDTTYEVDQFNVMKFLQGRVVIKWSAKPSQQKSKQPETKTQTPDLKEKLEEDKKDGK